MKLLFAKHWTDYLIYLPDEPRQLMTALDIWYRFPYLVTLEGVGESIVVFHNSKIKLKKKGKFILEFHNGVNICMLAFRETHITRKNTLTGVATEAQKNKILNKYCIYIDQL